MKKKWIIILIIIGVILVGYFLIKPKQHPDQESEAVTTVEEQPPAVEETHYIEAFGLVTATTVTNINIDFPARIRRILRKRGGKGPAGAGPPRFGCGRIPHRDPEHRV